MSISTTAFPTARRYFQWAVEQTFGSPGTNGLQDVSALDFFSAAVHRESIARVGGLTFLDDPTVEPAAKTHQLPARGIDNLLST